ncbi:P-loop containing nucleoside triphosphate hydrolase protein [Panus rudis PR-1116 ss-1]|nr:P-loop containing nucleoside triphosphate hydrolase protein [Panus rudis PR-1116 ss-1]
MAPKRHLVHDKWRRSTIEQATQRTAPATRPKVTDEDLNKLAHDMRQQFNWTADPREFQLEGTRAQLEGVDIIIQAPTGCGKTAVAAGPHVWSSSRGKITIVISPLLALEEEMVHTFETHFGLKAIAVHNKNGGCSPLAIKKLLSEEYQILLISPEMVQSRSFMNRVLRNSKFASRVLSMVVDEAHCISHWGADFRKKYGTLGVVRAFLPRSASVVAMTATLTARTRRDIHTKLQFVKGTSRFINVGNDRPNVSMVVRSCEHPLNTYADLDFIIPTSISSADEIPKTWVYADNISTGTAIIEHLREILQKHHPSLLATGDNIPWMPFAKGIFAYWFAPMQQECGSYRKPSRTGFSAQEESHEERDAQLRQDDTSATNGKKQKAKGKSGPGSGSKKDDAHPSAPQLPLDVEVIDEGLLVFVQSSSCRRETSPYHLEKSPGIITNYRLYDMAYNYATPQNVGIILASGWHNVHIISA